MRRRLLLSALFGASVAAGAIPPANAEIAIASMPGITDRLVIVADHDDDDADQRADGLSDIVAPAARVDLVTLDAKFTGAVLVPTSGRERARLVADGRVLAWGEKIPRGTAIQGLAPGRVIVNAKWPTKEAAIAVDVIGIGARDGQRRTIDIAKEHASLERTPPTRVDLEDGEEKVSDPDALRIVVTTAHGSPAPNVSVESLSAEGSPLDTLRNLRLVKVACDPPGIDLSCSASAPLRFVTDDIDRAHVLVSSRSIKAEVGGAIVVRDDAGRKLQAIRVAGPRQTSAGPLGRYRLQIHAVVMRLAAGAAPAVGGTDAGAIAAVRQELAVASAAWGQCGFTFGPSAQMDVRVMSPPPPYLVALGDDVGLPASGGEVRLKVDGRPIMFHTKKGWSTRQAALELQRVADGVGLKATLSENARIAPGASPSVDVAVRRKDGQLASVELVSSSDPTLSVHVGSVDFTDGLQHFGDNDSVAGTLEERTLVKAVEDDDPRTIEVIVVPFFAGGGRIGESFIASDGSSMRNVVIIDRAGVRARRSSLTLAHELGHVILDEPGHPDDYGIDTPSLLMDSDASDASPFGPRRISNDECARALRQSGPSARLPLFSEWKVGPLRYGK